MANTTLTAEEEAYLEQELADLGNSRSANLPLQGAITSVNIKVLETRRRAHQPGTDEYKLRQHDKDLAGNAAHWRTALCDPDDKGDPDLLRQGIGTGQLHRPGMEAQLRDDPYREPGSSGHHHKGPSRGDRAVRGGRGGWSGNVPSGPVGRGTTVYSPQDPRSSFGHQTPFSHKENFGTGANAMPVRGMAGARGGRGGQKHAGLGRAELATIRQDRPPFPASPDKRTPSSAGKPRPLFPFDPKRLVTADSEFMQSAMSAVVSGSKGMTMSKYAAAPQVSPAAPVQAVKDEPIAAETLPKLEAPEVKIRPESTLAVTTPTPTTTTADGETKDNGGEYVSGSEEGEIRERPTGYQDQKPPAVVEVEVEVLLSFDDEEPATDGDQQHKGSDQPDHLMDLAGLDMSVPAPEVIPTTVSSSTEGLDETSPVDMSGIEMDMDPAPAVDTSPEGQPMDIDTAISVEISTRPHASISQANMSHHADPLDRRAAEIVSRSSSVSGRSSRIEPTSTALGKSKWVDSGFHNRRDSRSGIGSRPFVSRHSANDMTIDASGCPSVQTSLHVIREMDLPANDEMAIIRARLQGMAIERDGSPPARSPLGDRRQGSVSTSRAPSEKSRVVSLGPTFSKASLYESVHSQTVPRQSPKPAAVVMPVQTPVKVEEESEEEL